MEPQSFHLKVIDSKQIFKGCAHLFGVPPVKQISNSDMSSILIAHHANQVGGDTSVHVLLWPNHKQESKYLMMYFMLVLNRTDKTAFSVGEGKLTGGLVQLYKPVQVSTSGLLHDSCTGFRNDHRCL